MREIPPDAHCALTFAVDEQMLAEFGGRRIHPVLSTWALVHHLEWAARMVLEPALEDGEEGVGVGVDIRHLGPAPQGAQVVVTARATDRRDGLLVCEVEARTMGRPVAKGRVFQAIVPRARWDQRKGSLEGAPAADGEE